MMRTTERDGGASAARRPVAQRQSIFDVLLQPPFAELSIARNLMNALSPAMPEAAAFVPQVEVREKDGNYLVDVALPGFKKDDIEIDVSGNELTISGKYEQRREDATLHYSEMRQGSFTRTITLPQEINADEVSATFEDGILHITAPPMAPVSHKKITIKAS